ncbi:hypothetical protein ACGFNU_19855 [Spirillospora sp. NPDC048911]|uniref:hypothetical protein n=1 Tax=Spirillospora sp. NPDC048911 TaxID=3364527 RepID=UPI00371C49CA
MDVAGFASHTRDDDDRRFVRETIFRMLEQAFSSSGLRLPDYYREDRGDGVLIIVPPDVPTRTVVDPMLARLETELRRHNQRAAAPVRIQLRAALHVGPVVGDLHGVFGNAITQAARLLEAPVLKSGLAESGGDLGFITSAYVYESVIREGPGFVDPSLYQPVEIQVKETELSAWMYLANGNSLRAVTSPGYS